LAKKVNRPPPSREAIRVPPRLDGLTFVIKGQLRYGDLPDVIRLIGEEGGTVVEEVAAGVDYLIVGWPKRGHPSDVMDRARRDHKALGDSLRIVDERDFYQLYTMTRDEALALLAGGPEGHDRWGKLTANLYHSSDRPGGIDLSGAPFRGADLAGVSFDRVRLQRNDFSGANLSGCRFDSPTSCNFDGATMRGAVVARARNCTFRDVDFGEGTVSDAEVCTFDGARIVGGGFTEKSPRNSVRGVDLSGTRFNPADVSSSDFTGSKLCRVDGCYSSARDAIFRDADLTAADFHKSHFERSDFSGADLGKADLRECDFTGAILRGARLVDADLRKAVLVDADLREANLQGANLSEADLRGASIDGADFEGAIVYKANLGGLDPERARTLARDRDQSGKAIGPRVRELAKLARESNELKTSVRLDLPAGQTALVRVWARKGTGGYHVHAYNGGPERGEGSTASTFERGMMDLAMAWPQGRLRPGGIEVEARKCPLKGAALLELATAAWREALGLPALSPEKFRRDTEAVEAARGELREAMMAELRGGRAGVEAWNARPWEERERVGPTRRIDLSGADLSGAELTSLDFDGARFDGARLVDANLRSCPIKGASFRDADLTQATFWACKGAEAVFEGSTMAGSNFDRAGVRRANFRSADLKAAYLGGADLRGADLTGADLAGADLSGALYDEQTRWPSGFDPPGSMRWRGKGPAPGAAPAKPDKAKGRRRSP
jgi:uncharacterized protein YjbI with pentapeptide repeats